MSKENIPNSWFDEYEKSGKPEDNPYYRMYGPFRIRCVWCGKDIEDDEESKAALYTCPECRS